MSYTSEQEVLFKERDLEREFRDLLSHKYALDDALLVLDKINWDFKEFKTQYLTHKFHSYPARFIPQIPLAFIKLFTKENETILDPFCGCGTVLVEAFLNNRNSIGNDFNPLAALIARVKTKLISREAFIYFNKKLAVMKHYLDLDYKKIDSRINNLPRRGVSKLFSRTVIAKLESIREVLISLKEEGHEDLYNFGRVALSSSIWSLVENNGEIKVDDLFMRKIKFMQNEMSKMKPLIKNMPFIRIVNGDARQLEIGNKLVDLVVTSPPYVNALDYYRVHMYNMLWLGMDFDTFRKHEIGGHSHFIANRFRLLSEYLGDMLRSMIEVNRVLKNEKLFVIVVGNSSLEYELIESYKYFVRMGQKVGFKALKVISRNIDKSKKYTSANIGKIDDEYILILQKISNFNMLRLDNEFISQIRKEQMLGFKEQIKKMQGTSIRGKKPTKERLLKNVDRISMAIETISQDIRIKK